MISWITDRMSLLIQTFTQWAEIVQARARSPTDSGAGGVLYLVIMVPLVLVGIYELVTIMTNFFRARSNDRYPLMAHADGLINTAKRPLQFHDLGFRYGFLGRMIRASRKKKAMTEDELLKAYIKARKKRERAEGEAEDKAFSKRYLNTASYREMEELFKLHQQQFWNKSLKSKPPVSNAGKLLSVLSGDKAWDLMVSQGMKLSGQGGSEMVPYEKQEGSAEKSEPIDVEGHTVGEGEYIGSAAWDEGLK